MRNQENIRNELVILFRNATPVCLNAPFFVITGFICCFQEHRDMQFEDLLKKLLILDLISLLANIELLITDDSSLLCEELVETTGAGAQSLVNLLHAVCL